MLDTAGEDEEEDTITLLTGGPKRIDCKEDDDFMMALDKVIAENFQVMSILILFLLYVLSCSHFNNVH